jgi:hypothetical protein
VTLTPVCAGSARVKKEREKFCNVISAVKYRYSYRRDSRAVVTNVRANNFHAGEFSLQTMIGHSSCVKIQRRQGIFGGGRRAEIP